MWRFGVLLLISIWVQPSTQQTYTYGGEECVFPFTYQGETFTECTSDTSWAILPWCGLVSEVPDETTPNTWGYCYGSSPPVGIPMPPGVVTTPPPTNCEDNVLTVDGDPCAIPFTYRGDTYDTCTTERNNGVPWCSLDAEYDGNWGVCDLSNCDEPTTTPTIAPTDPASAACTTVTGETCVFPFTFRNNEYNACTDERNNGVPWCSLDSVYSGNWGVCDLTVCSSTQPAVTPTESPASTCNVQTTSGTQCVLPFTYHDMVYETCTMINHDQYWCATTSTYSGAWGNCVLATTVDGDNCVFPFEYRGETYNGCTHAYATVPWCSLDAVYSGRWGECDLCP